MSTRLTTLGLCLACLSPSAPVLAQAGLLVPTSSGHPDPAVLSLREMEIQAGLARGYARVSVRQVFENHTREVQEGTYRFRLPLSAAVGDFAVWDGLMRIPGVIVEKRRARAIYRELTTQRIDPGLLQQGDEDDAEPGAPAAPGARPSGGSLFSVRVAPIPALGTKRLELQFQQEVPYVDGQAEFRLGLQPSEGQPPVAGRLRVTVRLDDGQYAPTPGSLPLAAKDGAWVFEGENLPLNRDLVLRFAPQGPPPLRVSAFRNPAGTLPDGLRLAPWERPGEIPPEKDGFFLLEAYPPAGAQAPEGPRGESERPPVTLGFVFDTSLSHRWAGLEGAYAGLVRALQSLTPKDRFALLAFDRKPVLLQPLEAATPEAIERALSALRDKALEPGSAVAAALSEASQVVGDSGRLVLFTDAPQGLSSKALQAARGRATLFTALSGEEAPEAVRSASAAVLPPGATGLETDLFFKRLVAPVEKAPVAAPRPAGLPFRATGDAGLRDVYPVLVQPLAGGSLSGFVGRYARPQPAVAFELPSKLFPGGLAKTSADLPETALDARDLPRRWARARVDHLLALIEAEGERREWIDEIIALSKRYNFVTPYTAFLAAPRSLLRPRRIQPGDPVLRVECDAGVVSATALLPFGLRLPLERRPGTHLWEGRFLVPEGLRDGRYEVRILLRDRSGARLSETKRFVLDGTAPVIRAEVPGAAQAGAPLRVLARTDADVVVLNARLGDGAPVPLRWDDAAKASIGTLRVPAALSGPQELFLEAVDGAKNHGFARLRVEVLP